MTTTTYDMNKAFADEMKLDLGIHIRLSKKQYEEAQAKMLADLQTNPISAAISAPAPPRSVSSVTIGALPPFKA